MLMRSKRSAMASRAGLATPAIKASATAAAAIAVRASCHEGAAARRVRSASIRDRTRDASEGASGNAIARLSRVMSRSRRSISCCIKLSLPIAVGIAARPPLEASERPVKARFDGALRTAHVFGQLAFGQVEEVAQVDDDPFLLA